MLEPVLEQTHTQDYHLEVRYPRIPRGRQPTSCCTPPSPVVFHTCSSQCYLYIAAYFGTFTGILLLVCDDTSVVGPRLEATDTVAIGTRLSEGGMRRRADGGDLYGRGERAKQREPTAFPVRSSAHSIMRVYTYVRYLSPMQVPLVSGCAGIGSKGVLEM